MKDDNELILTRSNALITSKSKLNLLANKICVIALTRIQSEGSKEQEKLVSRLYPGEIQALVGKKENIYRELKRAALLMTGQSTVIDTGNGNFKAFTYIHKAIYEDGVLSIEFDDEIRPHIFELQRNYTPMSLSTLTGFEKDASFRIYEVLYKDMYRSDPKVNQGEVTIAYNLSEFRFMIGLANINEDGVQSYLTRNKVIDWDYLFETVSKEKKYENWTDFKRYVLEPARIELKETSDIQFTFEGVRSKGNKIGKLIFHVKPNNLSKEAREKFEHRLKIIEDQQGDYIQLEFPRFNFEHFYQEFIGHNGLIDKDLDILLKTADMKEELVREAIERADKEPYLNNYMGWLISYIRNGGYEKVAVMDGSKEKAEKINDLMEKSHSLKTQERVWKKTVDKPDFQEFLSEIGMPLKVFEADYPDLGERIQLYSEWRMERI